MNGGHDPALVLAALLEVAAAMRGERVFEGADLHAVAGKVFSQ